MKKTVLILTYSGDDEHVARVTEELRRCGVRALAFQTDLYPTRRRPSIAIDDDDFTFSLQLGRHKVSSSSQLIGIWNRRLRDPQMSVALRSSANRAAALLDCQRFLEGLWQILEGCNWFSGTPEATRRADSKILQLQVATSMLSRYPSMHVPDTRIIVQPKQLIEFWERCAGEVLFKGLGVLAPEVGRDIYTVRLTSDFNAGSVRYAPGIYQKLVPKTFDVRVTVVGERVFACAIRSQESGVLDALVDWRRDPNFRWKHINFLSRLRSFVSSLWRRWACVVARLI